jgi:hypothetical protein
MYLKLATHEIEPSHDVIDIDIEEEEKTYQYQTLEDHMIRVIHLHDNRNKLECFIRHVKISKSRYQALSYEWGSPDTSFQIQVLDDEN